MSGALASGWTSAEKAPSEWLPRMPFPPEPVAWYGFLICQGQILKNDSSTSSSSFDSLVDSRALEPCKSQNGRHRQRLLDLGFHLPIHYIEGLKWSHALVFLVPGAHVPANPLQCHQVGLTKRSLRPLGGILKIAVPKKACFPLIFFQLPSRAGLHHIETSKWASATKALLIPLDVGLQAFRERPNCYSNQNI